MAGKYRTKMALVKKEPTDSDEAGHDMEAEEGGRDGVEMSAISPEYERSQLPDLLKIYYRWLFPYDKYFDWLQYGMWLREDGEGEREREREEERERRREREKFFISFR